MILLDRENLVLFVWCSVKFYFVLMVQIDYPTHYVKVLDNRQVYDKQHLLCKQSFASSPISDYDDTYNILYILCIMPNNYSCSIQYPITQYPIPCGNSWKLSALQHLIFLQIIYNHLQNLFDKIIVFQIDFYIFNHVIFIPPDQKWGGYVNIYIFGNNCHFGRTCSITVSTKIFRLCPQNPHFPKQFPTFSQINTFC